MNCQALRIILLIFTAFISITVSAQNQDYELRALEELEKRGISREEFVAKMNEKGVDIENVDPSELPRLQGTIQEAIYEIQQEKRALKELEEDSDSTDFEVGLDPFGDTIKVKEVDTVSAEVEVDDSNDVKIYGQHVFKNGNINTYKTNTSAVPSKNYLIGPGDRINISIWGRSQENASFDVPEDGIIKPSQMPPISLKGLTLDQARQLLRKRYRQFYNFRDEEFSVTIAQSRTVVVSVYGEVDKSGSYSLSAFNTAVNAIAAAGGVTDLGSVRNIKIIRNSGEVVELDIYDWIEGRTTAQDIYLYNNDVVHVPVAENIVTIEGGINRPMKYEMKKGEGIKELVRYAGGLSENGFGDNISVSRYQNGKFIVENASINQGNLPLINGDQVIVKKVVTEKEDFVSTEGAFTFAGDYKFQEGMRVSDLIQVSPLAEDAYTELVFVKRQKPDSTFQFIKVNLDNVLEQSASQDNIPLLERDVLVVYSQKRFVDNLTYVVTGAVREPDTFQYDVEENIKVSDAIILAGNILPEAMDFAYVHRRDPYSKELIEYFRVPVREVLQNPESNLNISIRPLDSIVVYNQKDFMDEATVIVKGAVRKPDTLLYDKSLTLRDALTLAGGLKLEASRNRIEITSISFEDAEDAVTTTSNIYMVDENFLANGEEVSLKPYDIIQVRALPKFEFQKTVQIDGEVVYPGNYAIVDENERLSDVIKRAGGLTEEAFAAGATLYRVQDNTGFIVIELDDIMRNPLNNSNITLKEGDVITIPKSKEFVTIIGETKASELYPEKVFQGGRVNVPYAGRRNAKWYVDNYAAGIGDEGRSRLITVEHPNGEIEKTDNYLIYKTFPEVRPGSVIKVGRLEKKIRKKKEDKEKVDWERVVANSLGQATAIISLILLIQRIE